MAEVQLPQITQQKTKCGRM